jgi:integrase/recombinase XerD
MAVNLRKVYRGKEKVSEKNRPYNFQLDYYNNGKRIRETIKDVKFLPTDTKEQRKQKRAIINKIKADLEIEHIKNLHFSMIEYNTIFDISLIEILS